MAIDSSIALQGRAPQMDNPLQTLGQLYALQNAGTDSQLNRLKLTEAQQGYHDTQATRAAVGNNVKTNPDGSVSLDQAGTLGELYKTAPTQALNLQNEFAVRSLAIQKGTAEAQKLDLENNKAKVDLLGQLSGSIHDQASYEAATKQMVQMGLIDPRQVPPTYDPELVRQVQINALTAKDHLDLQQKQQEFLLNEQKAGETQRHDVVTEQATQTGQTETARHNRAEEGISRTGQQIQLNAQQLGLANDLRTQLNSVTEPYRQQTAAYNTVVTAAQKQTPASDLEMMYGIMKLMNPSGGIRPGALQTIEDANSGMGKVQLQYNNLVSGATLTPTQRANLVEQALNLYNTATQQNQQVTNSITNIARRHGLNPEDVTMENTSVMSPDNKTGTATHSFSVSAWAAANPGKDANAAAALAKQQGYTVTK